MSTHLRIVICIAIFIYFIKLLRLIKQRRVMLKYTLLWLLAGVVMIFLVISPELLKLFVKIVGIQTPMYGLIMAILAFIIAILLSLTVIVSWQAEKIKNLTQKMGIYEKRIRELEE